MMTFLAILTFVAAFLIFLVLIGKAGIMVVGTDHPVIEFHLCSGCVTFGLLWVIINVAWAKNQRLANAGLLQAQIEDDDPALKEEGMVHRLREDAEKSDGSKTPI